MSNHLPARDARSARSSTSGTPEVRQRPGPWRRHRSTLLIIAAFAIALALAVWNTGSPETRDDLDPDNPHPNGARALARVLEAEGVDVDVARGLNELESSEVPAGSTLVVTSTHFLSRDVLRSVQEQAEVSRIVLVGPSQRVLRAAGVGIDTTIAESDDDAWPAECADPTLRDLTLEVDRATGYTGGGCFPTGNGGALVAERDPYTFVGAAAALSNDQILRGDNAAFALRLLGEADTLLWYVPSPADAAPGEGATITSLLPRFVLPGLFLLTLAMAAVVLWRVRRLGPLATEPLPVSVKAIETTLSRGRLYRRAGDRAHAASRLRAATRTRLTERLHGSAHPEEHTVVRDLAQHLGRSEEELASLIGSDAPSPATDRDLINLAGSLAALEEEVRRR